MFRSSLSSNIIGEWNIKSANGCAVAFVLAGFSDLIGEFSFNILTSTDPAINVIWFLTSGKGDMTSRPYIFTLPNDFGYLNLAILIQSILEVLVVILRFVSLYIFSVNIVAGIAEFTNKLSFNSYHSQNNTRIDKNSSYESVKIFQDRINRLRISGSVVIIVMAALSLACIITFATIFRQSAYFSVYEILQKMEQASIEENINIDQLKSRVMEIELILNSTEILLSNILEFDLTDENQRSSRLVLSDIRNMNRLYDVSRDKWIFDKERLVEFKIEEHHKLLEVIDDRAAELRDRLDSIPRTDWEGIVIRIAIIGIFSLIIKIFYDIYSKISKERALVEDNRDRLLLALRIPADSPIKRIAAKRMKSLGAIAWPTRNTAT